MFAFKWGSSKNRQTNLQLHIESGTLQEIFDLDTIGYTYNQLEQGVTLRVGKLKIYQILSEVPQTHIPYQQKV